MLILNYFYKLIGDIMSKQIYSQDKIKQIINNQNIKFLRLMFTDIAGMIKNVEVPVSQLDKVLDNKIMFDGSSIQGFVRINESDMYIYPDLNSFLILPWESDHGKVARLICDIYNPDGTVFTGDPRSNLKRVIKNMQDFGFDEFNLGPEAEFFLFELDENKMPSLKLNDSGSYFDLAPVDLGEDCRRDIVLELEKLGFEIEASHHEVAIGQHEIDFKYSGVLETCDNIQTFKLLVKTIARRHNLYASFMPKPIFGINGSGMHCNMSLFKQNKNIFYDPDDKIKISREAYSFLAGLLKHAKAFTAITNPIINSYKRLVPGYEAPVYISWGLRNRSPLIRIPESRGMSTRLELRSVDPTANPYLALAVLLECGLDGIKNNLQAPEPIESNIFAMTKSEREALGIQDLPANLHDALKEFIQNKIIKQALGEHIFNSFVKSKQLEWQSYSQIISQWELDNYLRIY